MRQGGGLTQKPHGWCRGALGSHRHHMHHIIASIDHVIDDIVIGGSMTKPGTPRTERDLERLTRKRSEYSPDEKARYERYKEQRDRKVALRDLRQKLRQGTVWARSSKILTWEYLYLWQECLLVTLLTCGAHPRSSLTVYPPIIF